MTNQTPQGRRREPQSGVAIQSFAGLLRFPRKDGLCKGLLPRGMEGVALPLPPAATPVTLVNFPEQFFFFLLSAQKYFFRSRRKEAK
jgi:hypothetical protein